MVRQVIDAPLGFVFNPEADELVQYYLEPKILNQPMYMDIPAVEIYNNDPRSSPEILLDELFPIVGEPYDKQWYFFTHLKGKHGVDSKHSDRVCGGGCWKASNKKKEIYSKKNGRDTEEVIGFQRVLTYHVGGKKIGNWIMYEYQINHNNPRFIQEKENNKGISAPSTATDDNNKIKEIVLCHIHIKSSAVAAAKKKKENCEAHVYDDQNVMVLQAAPEIHNDIEFNVQAYWLNPNLVEATNAQEKEDDLEEYCRELENYMADGDDDQNTEVVNNAEEHKEKEEDDLQEFGWELENYIIAADDEKNTDQNVGTISNTEEHLEKEEDGDLYEFNQNLENDLLLVADDENWNISDADFFSELDGLSDFPPIEEQFRDSYPTEYQDNNVERFAGTQEEYSNPADGVITEVSVEEEEEVDDWSLIDDDLSTIPLGPTLLYDKQQSNNNNNEDLLDVSNFLNFNIEEEDVGITRKRTRNDIIEDDQAANKRRKY